MEERKISNHKLAKETSLSRQSISKIKNNKFHDISVNVLTELLEYFDVSFEQFGTTYSRDQYMQWLISKKCFSKKNIKLLETLLSKNLNLSCKYQPYSSKEKLNIYSKKYFKKFSFTGNIRVNTTLYGLTFEIIDFDLNRTSNNFQFDDFYSFYGKLLVQLEKYAQNLGFTQIIININPQAEPRNVNNYDLEFLMQHSNQENEFLKITIIKELGYTEYFYNTSQQAIQLEKDIINNSVDSMKNLTFFEKEKKRLDIFSNQNLGRINYTRKFIKQINSEVISKEKLEKDVHRQFGWI